MMHRSPSAAAMYGGDYEMYGTPVPCVPVEFMVPLGNPLLAHHPVRAMYPPYGGTPKVPYATTLQQARMIAAYNNARRRYGQYVGGGHSFDVVPRVAQQMGPSYIPGRSYSSMGGAGPYGLNVPLGALAEGDPVPYSNQHALNGLGQPIPPLRSHYGTPGPYGHHGNNLPPHAQPPGVPYDPLGPQADGLGPQGPGYGLGPEPLRGPGGLPYNRPVMQSEGGLGHAGGAGGYGLGVEINQQQREQQLPYQRQVLNRQGPGPSPVGGFGLDAEVGGGVGPVPPTPRLVAGLGGGGVGGGFGLDAEVDKPHMGVDGGGVGGGGGGFGLDAEVREELGGPRAGGAALRPLPPPAPILRR